jgi:hypothetical protein
MEQQIMARGRFLFLPFLLPLPLFATNALAQQNAIGFGVGQANATSNPSANSQGGNANANNGLTINNNGNPATTRSDQTLDQVQTLRGGTSSVTRQTGGLRNVPAVFAPGLASAGIETCLGSISAGGAGMGFGISFGSTVTDSNCNARLDSRTLWSMGLKKAAVARLCLTPEIQRSMPEVCAEYLPQQPTTNPGYVATVAAPVPAAPARAVARLEPVAAPRLEPVEYNGGRVMVIEKRTGRERPCENYSNGHCLQWGR